jgi:hypothetical protein
LAERDLHRKIWLIFNSLLYRVSASRETAIV